VFELADSVGALIIDESFCDLYPHLSVLPLTTEQQQNIIVFRSLGKFYGLAGLRLGFVFSHSKTLKQFASAAGKWAVSAPALSIGADALQDENWRQQTMIKLTHDARRLDRIAQKNGLHLNGGTDLFRLYQCDDAKNIQDKLAGHKIWSRVFSYSENWIRLGIPPNTGWEPLERALQS
jgi:cobalamin biosynthetic protein CobC